MKLRHLIALLLILSALVWLLAGCSAEKQSPQPTAQEEAVREIFDQEQTVQIEPQKPDQTDKIQKNIRTAVGQMIQSQKLKIGDVGRWQPPPP